MVLGGESGNQIGCMIPDFDLRQESGNQRGCMIPNFGVGIGERESKGFNDS